MKLGEIVTNKISEGETRYVKRYGIYGLDVLVEGEKDKV